MVKEINKTDSHRFAEFISDETLNLSRQHLTDADIMDVISFLHQYPNIKKLDISLNNIGDQGLADFSERNQTVTQVNFAGNNISDNGIAIFAYKNLTIVQADFSQNPISDEGIYKFAKINQICQSSQFSTVRYH